MSTGVVLEHKTGSARFLDQVAVLILTFNEAHNIGRTLDALTSFSEIVVLDSGSNDETVAIASRYPNVRIATRSFDTHAAQWNFGLMECGIARPWVLALDADYVLSPQLVEEIARQPMDPPVQGYAVQFRYCIHGRRLTAALYPSHVVLFRRDRARYVQSGHTQRVIVDGELGRLDARIDHDDRKPLARWLQSQQKYARLEADHLLSLPPGSLRRSDRLRLMGWPAPLLVPLYVLFFKRCVFDGWPGWIYVLQRTLAEVMIALEINDCRQRALDTFTPEGE